MLIMGQKKTARKKRTAVTTAVSPVRPPSPTPAALIVVGFLMMTIVKDIEWNEFTEAFPAFLTILTIPLTYSISKGIGYGFISYVLVKTFSGKLRDVHPLMYLIALMFALDFLFSSLH